MSYETASIMCPYLEDAKLLGANLFAGYVRSHVKGILLSDRVPFAIPACHGFMAPRFLAQFLARIPCPDSGRRPPGDETACGSWKSPYSGNYRRYRTPPVPITSAPRGVAHYQEVPHE